jgi:hypothetical protein
MVERRPAAWQYPEQAMGKKLAGVSRYTRSPAAQVMKSLFALCIWDELHANKDHTTISRDACP